MKLNLTVPMVNMLNAMIRDTHFLPLAKTSPEIRPYQAGDLPGQLQVIRLRKWLEREVFVPVEDGKFKFVAREVGLSRKLVERVQAMLEHYKALAGFVELCEPYVSLKHVLEGKGWSEEDYCDYFDPEDMEDAEAMEAMTDQNAA